MEVEAYNAHSFELKINISIVKIEIVYNRIEIERIQFYYVSIWSGDPGQFLGWKMQLPHFLEHFEYTKSGNWEKKLK